MKVKLCVLSALVLLSSITIIFNNIVVEEASAQQVQKGADNVYTGYENSVPPVNDNDPNEYSVPPVNDNDPNEYSVPPVYDNDPNEYSSYDNYEPSEYSNIYDSGDNEAYVKNLNNIDYKYSEYPTEEIQI